MFNRSAIHARVIVVSARNHRVVANFAKSPAPL